MAAHFAAQAVQAEESGERNAYLELERLWAEMAALAVRFDREFDGAVKAQIYAIMQEVEVVRQKVA
jgi:hypothetical protein